MDVAIEGILGVHALLHFLVLISELFCLLDHLLDLLLGQTALVICDRDLLALASGLILSTNVENAVGIDLKGHLNLWLSTRSRRDTAQLELAQQVVILGHGALALENLNVYCWLVILVSGEDLGL